MKQLQFAKDVSNFDWTSRTTLCHVCVTVQFVHNLTFFALQRVAFFSPKDFIHESALLEISKQGFSLNFTGESTPPKTNTCHIFVAVAF